MEFKLLNIVTIKRSKASLDPNEKQKILTWETAIACHDGYGWLPVLKEHLIAVESSIFIALWKMMVWSSCIISRACAQQAIILFLKWNENSEIFIEKCWKQTK